MRKKALSFILLLAMMFTLLPTEAFAVSDRGDIATNVGVGTIYFGNKADGTTPSLYRVVAKDHDTITLFYDGSHVVPIVAFESLMQYHNEDDHKKWSGSTICAWLNGNEFLSNTSVFTPAEKAAIATQYSTTGETLNGVTITPNQSIVLPSFAEVSDSGIWDMNQTTRSSSNGWRLRSPGVNAWSAEIVDLDGTIYHNIHVKVITGVRPAFKLNLSSVLFASAAAGGKSGTAGVNLSKVIPPAGAQKLTILDSAHTLATATTSGIMAAGETITVNYGGASTGKTLSAIVTDKTTGAVTYYGKLVENVVSESGMASVKLPDTFESSSMELKLFTETINGDNKTDYASSPVSVSFTAPATYAVLVNNGTGSDNYAENATVTITADSPQTGKRFKEWTGADGLTFTNSTSKNSAVAKFNMPANPVTVTATYENISTSSGGGSSGGSRSMGSSTDSTTGIKAEGTLYSNITVNPLNNSKTGASNEVVDEIAYNELKVLDGGFTVIGAYEIKCASYSGSLTLSFPVDAKYNGQKFIVKHKTSDGKINTYTGTVKDGKVVIKVPSLSPFMIAVKCLQEKLKDEVWVNPFIDVKEHDWFYENAALVCKLGLMQGTSATSFEPKRSTTRGMIVTVLYNMAGKPEVQASGVQWYAKGSTWAIKSGISDGTNMESEITREQLVTQLWRNAASPAVTNDSGLLTFTDAGTISDYAKQAFAWAIKQGIIQGKGNNILDPQGNATRAEVATMIIHYLNAMKK